MANPALVLVDCPTSVVPLPIQCAVACLTSRDVLGSMRAIVRARDTTNQKQARPYKLSWGVCLAMASMPPSYSKRPMPHCSKRPMPALPPYGPTRVGRGVRGNQSRR